MLTRIHIRNIALIDEISLELSPKLNVLSGETGAGKSIIIDSIGLVLGERADRELIQTGADRAAVEVTFVDDRPQVINALSELGIEHDDELILSRELWASGRNVCRINGTLVNNAALKRISSLLIDILGQHQHQAVFDTATHLHLLDTYIGSACANYLVPIRQQRAELQAIEKQLQMLGGQFGERERRMDMLQYQIREIESANLQLGEEEALRADRLLMQNAERVMESLSTAYDCLYGDTAKGAMELIDEAARNLQSIAELDPAFAEAAERAQELYYTAEAVTDVLRSKKNSIDCDPMLLEQIESRLAVIAGIKKKYGGSVEAVLAFKQEAQETYDALEHAAETIEMLREQRETVIKRLYQDCSALSALRREKAHLFEKAVAGELEVLGMKRAVLEVQFSAMPSLEEVLDNCERIGEDGIDTVEFMFSANLGEPVKPLVRVASGGEASRIMLAFKNITARLDGIPSMIFDEIDTGISGEMAHVVAKKMAAISRDQQVICVTHLPQLACMADAHYLIEKIERHNRTETQIISLDQPARVREIARLLGGEGAQGHGYAHAAELLDNAQKIKSM